MEKDLVVIGGGPGGYVAAIRAAQLGAKVTLIEKERIGGTCLNRGCIPTKAFYKNAQFLNSLNHSLDFGVKLEGYNLNFGKVQERKRTIVQKLTRGVESLVKQNGIELIEGFGRILDKNTVEATDKNNKQYLIKTKNILIATGSKTAKPPIKGLNLPGVVTSDELLEIESIPRNIVIIGGGVIGIEYAGIFNAFGSKVTVVEFLPSILNSFDGEIVKKLTSSLKKRGIRIETGTKVEEVCKKGDNLLVAAEGPKGKIEIEGDLVLVSTGRSVNIEDLNLEKVGVNYDKSGIKVDKNFCTSIPGIYAIGDAIGGIMLAHVASEEGKAAVSNIMGEKGHVDYDIVPNCVFTFPEVASVGLSEEALKAKGIPYTVSKFMLSGNGKALTMGEEEGMVKVIASEDKKEIFGVHLLGPSASDLIHESVIAMKGMLSINEVADTIHGHPSLSEAFVEAVMGIEGRAIHMLPSKK